MQVFKLFEDAAALFLDDVEALLKAVHLLRGVLQLGSDGVDFVIDPLQGDELFYLLEVEAHGRILLVERVATLLVNPAPRP